MSPDSAPVPLSAEDLTFWYADQPRQRTTMAMLMLLDRAPDPRRLRAAAWRAAERVPRLRQCVVDAPLDLALPRWEEDATFDLDFHVRRYAQPPVADGEDALADLFRTLGPIYERPFDRTRPLWEMIEIDRPGGRSALFFRLHHAVADGVGGNTILAALTDASRDGEPLALAPEKAPGAWSEPREVERVLGALWRRAGEDAERSRRVAGALAHAALHPSALWRAGRMAAQLADDARFRSGSPLTGFGRSRHLAGIDLALDPLREAKRALGGTMVDLLCAGVAGAIGRWHREHGHGHVSEIPTLVPINLRPLSEQNESAGVGNRATGIVLRLPVAIEDPAARFREIHRRVEERKAHPITELLPELGGLATGLPKPLFKAFARSVSGAIELIVTNVPGLPTARYLAGAEITAAYPFAPTAPHAPVSIALYGYRGRLHIGLDADGTAMQDLGLFCAMLSESFERVVAAAARAKDAAEAGGAE
jgi:WS/DGAT/MGAT family acyltransferase